MWLQKDIMVVVCSALSCVLLALVLSGKVRAQHNSDETTPPPVTLVPFDADLTDEIDISEIADVDGDGNQDILASCVPGVSDPVSKLYFGDGQGGFTEMDAGFTGVRQGDISTADVNGDGSLDLLVAGDANSVNSSGGESAKLYLGDGQGGFSEANTNLTGVQRSSTSIADVNGDGNPDLLITGVGDTDGDSGREETTTLYIGDGQGNFAKADAELAGVDGGATSIADVDGDGNPDLLVSGDETTIFEGGVSTTLYLGDGQGNFSEADAGLTGIKYGSNSIADVDGDGNMDILVGTKVYISDGEGNFSRAYSGIPNLSYYSSAKASDINGDGKTDIVVSGDTEQEGSKTNIYLGDGEGNFYVADAGLTNLIRTSMSIADIEDDGDNDLLISGYIDEGTGSNVSNIYKNVSVYSPNELSANPGDMQVSLDWNSVGSNNPDGYNIYRSTTPFSNISNAERLNTSLLSSTDYTDTEVENGTKYFYRVTATTEGIESDPSGEATAIPSEAGAVSLDPLNAGLAGVQGASTSIADVNGDGDNDLVITGDTDSDPVSTSPATTLYLGDGQGGFTVADAGLTDVNDGSVSTADVNGDGNSDILITGSTSNSGRTTALYFGNNQGGVDKVDAGLTGVSASSSSIADVNGNGNPDLLVVGDRNGTDSGGLSATLYLGDGQGNFSVANAGLSGTRRGDSSIRDVNGDGNPDVLITGRDLSAADDATATLYIGDGQGGFTEADAGLGGVSSGATSIADVNRDGNPDLLMTGDGNGAFSGGEESTLYLGNGQGGFSESDAGLTGVAFSSTSIADANGDGNLDLLITGEAQGGDQIARLYMGNGAGGFSEAEVELEGVSVGASSIADVNGDAIPDLLIAGASNFAPTATLYENKSEYAPPSDGPINLSASSSDGQVNLSWLPNESNPSEYNVYRSTSSFIDISEATEVANVSSTNYMDEGVTNGTEYFYRVTAVDGEGTESQPSGEVAVTPPGIQEESVLSAYSEIAKSVADTRFGRSLQEEYENQNIKHLGLIQAGLFDLLEAGVFIDLDDYFGITEEGQNDYITVWLNASGSIGVSLLPFDLGIIRTKYTEGIPDPRGGFDLSLSGIRAGSIQIEAFKKMEKGDVQPVSWEFNDSFELNASASFGNLAWQFYQFEMKRDVLNDIVEASLDATSPPTTVGKFSGDILFNLLFDFPESPLENPIPEFDPAVDAPSDVRFLTRTDDGNAPEIASTINYGRGGMDTDDDGFRDNKYPVIEERYLRTVLGGWEFNLKFTSESKEGVVTDYGVSPIDIPDGWYIKPYKDGEDTLPNISDREWNANDLSPGESIVTRWQVSPTDPTQSPVQIGFELYEDKAFSDTPLDTLYVEFKQEGSVSAFAARPTATSQSNSSTTSPGPKTRLSSSGSLVDSTRDTPFKLLLETPSGETISPTSVDLTESRYMEADFDSSGTVDAQYVIANPEDGNYSVTVEPVSDTPEGARITVEAVTSGTAQTVAKDQPIPEEGSDTYSVDTDPLDSRPPRTAFDVLRNFGDASGPSDYRLMALPGAIDRSLSTVVEGEAGTSWKAFWDNGDAEDFFVEYDGSETFSLEPGRGFWLTRRGTWTAQDSIETVSLGGDRSASIPLHEGWNIISNPLSVDVAWSSMEMVNGVSLQPLWAFDGSFAEVDTFRSARSGEAFYFLNDAGLDSLEVPYPAAAGGESQEKAESLTWGKGVNSGEGSLITIRARPKNGNGPTSAVKVGFDEEASKGLGRLDEPAPPGRFSELSLRLQASGEAPRRRSLMTERRPPTDGPQEGHTFDLRLQARAGGPVQITADGLSAIGSYEAKLLRPSSGRGYDLAEGTPVAIEDADSTGLRLAIGSASYVEEQERQVVPDEMGLTSYPNPTHGQTTVEYTLPEAEEVTLEVYDVLGRRVATLEEGRKEAGRHQVDLQAERLSSGVYFGRLRVGDQTRTQKITVVR